MGEVSQNFGSDKAFRIVNSQFLCSCSKISPVDSPRSHTSCCKTISFVSALLIFELTNCSFRTRGLFLYSSPKLCVIFPDLNKLSYFERFPICINISKSGINTKIHIIIQNTIIGTSPVFVPFFVLAAAQVFFRGHQNMGIGYPQHV